MDVEETQPQQPFHVESQSEVTDYLSQSVIFMIMLMGINTTLLSCIRKSTANHLFVTKYLPNATITTLVGMYRIHSSLILKEYLLAVISRLVVNTKFYLL